MIISHTHGLVAAPFTPMKENGDIMLKGIVDYKTRLIKNGLSGAFIAGSTGEGTSLNSNERKALTAAWTEQIQDDFKIIVHVGSNSIKESCELAEHAATQKAQAIAATGPSYFKPNSVETLVAYMAQIAHAAPELPFYYYHIPSLNQNYLSAVRFLELAQHEIPNLAGIKFTHDDEMEFQLCRQVMDGKLDMLYGRDETLICGLVLGATGGVGSTYNFMPRLYLDLMSAFKQGRFDEANRLQLLAMRIITIYSTYRGLAAGKAIMKLLGVDCGGARLPNQSLSNTEIGSLKKALDQLDFWSYSLT